MSVCVVRPPSPQARVISSLAWLPASNGTAWPDRGRNPTERAETVRRPALSGLGRPRSGLDRPWKPGESPSRVRAESVETSSAPYRQMFRRNGPTEARPNCESGSSEVSSAGRARPGYEAAWRRRGGSGAGSISATKPASGGSVSFLWATNAAPGPERLPPVSSDQLIGSTRRPLTSPAALVSWQYIFLGMWELKSVG